MCQKSKNIAYDNYEIIIVDNGSAEDYLKLKVHNCGAVLQAYAMQNYFKQKGIVCIL